MLMVAIRSGGSGTYDHKERLLVATEQGTLSRKVKVRREFVEPEVIT